MEHDLNQAVDNLVQLLYVPSQDAQIILYSSLLHCLQDDNLLKAPKSHNYQVQNVRSLCIQLLQNEKIMCHVCYTHVT